MNTPTKDETFLQRICTALEVTPRGLARKLGVPYKEIEPLLSPRHMLAEIDRDPTWWKISEFVDRRIAMHMAVKNELNKALQQDRVKRAARLGRLQRRDSVSLSKRRE